MPITRVVLALLLVAPITAAAAAPRVAVIDTPITPSSALWHRLPVPASAVQMARSARAIAAATGCRVSNHGDRTLRVIHALSDGARLLPVPVLACDDHAIAPASVAEALRWAKRRNAAILHLSMTYDPVRMAAQEPAAVLRRLDRSERVLVAAAGNGVRSLTPRPATAASAWREGAPLADQTLIVGTRRGGRPPGGNATLQGRFLIAPSRGAVRSGGRLVVTSGTSAAAARVTAALARLQTRFPERTPTAIARTLLATARRDHLPGYGRRDCGPRQDTDCGYYRYGQGELDTAAAARALAVSAGSSRSIPTRTRETPP